MGKHVLRKDRSYKKLYRSAGIALAIPVIGLGGAAASLADVGTSPHAGETVHSIPLIPTATDLMDRDDSGAASKLFDKINAALDDETDPPVEPPIEPVDPPVEPPIDPPIEPTDPPVVPPVDPPVEPTDPPVVPPVEPPVAPPVNPPVDPPVDPPIVPGPPAVNVPQLPVADVPQVPVVDQADYHTQAGPQLAYTGADDMALALLGAGGIALGGGAMLIAKKRPKTRRSL